MPHSTAVSSRTTIAALPEVGEAQPAQADVLLAQAVRDEQLAVRRDHRARVLEAWARGVGKMYVVCMYVLKKSPLGKMSVQEAIVGVWIVAPGPLAWPG